jgi:hypothetical protein
MYARKQQSQLCVLCGVYHLLLQKQFSGFCVDLQQLSILISAAFWAESRVCLGASAQAPFLHICDSYPIVVSHLSFNFLRLLLHISVNGNLNFQRSGWGGGGCYSIISTEPEFVNVSRNRFRQPV